MLTRFLHSIGLLLINFGLLFALSLSLVEIFYQASGPDSTKSSNRSHKNPSHIQIDPYDYPFFRNVEGNDTKSNNGDESSTSPWFIV